MKSIGFDFDPSDPTNIAEENCPSCGGAVCLADSLNWGNIIAECRSCHDQWDWTEVDHAANYREARRG